MRKFKIIKVITLHLYVLGFLLGCILLIPLPLSAHDEYVVLWEKHVLHEWISGKYVYDVQWIFRNTYKDLKLCGEAKFKVWEYMVSQKKVGPENPGIKNMSNVKGKIIKIIFLNDDWASWTYLCVPGSIDPRPL